ncbi:UNVERIFIED_CONTAM: single-stranded DNA-binding protein [Campylobacter lari]
MNLNKTIIIGKIASEIDYRTTNSGITIARTTVAVERNIASDRVLTDYIPVIAFTKIADLLHNYANKGTLIAIEGSNIVNTNTQNDQIFINMEVRINNFEFLESKAQRLARNINNTKTENLTENTIKKSFNETESKNDEPKFGGLSDDEYNKLKSFGNEINSGSDEFTYVTEDTTFNFSFLDDEEEI